MKRIGAFDVRAGMFERNAADLLPTSRPFGLTQVATWFYAHLRSSRSPDKHYHLLRAIRADTTVGMGFAVSTPEGVVYDDRVGDFLRGGSFRRFVDENGDLAMRGSAGFYAGKGGPKVEATVGTSTGKLFWDDSGILKLEGKAVPPGGHFIYSPWMPAELGASLHTIQWHTVEGELFGEPVHGICGLENGWNSAPIVTWGGAPVAQAFQHSWCAFVHQFEDGTYQHGEIADWGEAGKFFTIWDDGRHISGTIDDVEITYRADGFVDRMIYLLSNGERWEYVSEDSGALLGQWEMSQLAGENMRCQKGTVGRVGDTRVRKYWYAFQEAFPDRLAGRPEPERKAGAETLY